MMWFESPSFCSVVEQLGSTWFAIGQNYH